MFLESRSSCDPSQRNPFIKKISAYLCLCGPSYLSSGRGPSASSSRLTSSPGTFRVSSLTGLSVFLPSSVSLPPTSCDRFTIFLCPLVDSYVSLTLLVTDWPCSCDCPLVHLLFIWRGEHSYFRTTDHPKGRHRDSRRHLKVW